MFNWLSRLLRSSRAGAPAQAHITFGSTSISRSISRTGLLLKKQLWIWPIIAVVLLACIGYALRVAIEAIMDAADEDLGTGGPDLNRGIFPTVTTITRSGLSQVPEDEIRRHCEAILGDRGRL